MANRHTPPGPPGHFLFGSLRDYMADSLGFMSRCAREHGDVVRVRLGALPCYLFFHPDQIDEILRTRSQHFIKDRPLQISTMVFGKGLLTSEGDFWRRQRRLVQPAFLSQQVQSYGEVMVAAAERMLESWHGGQERDVYADFTELTLDIVARALFDTDLSGETRELAAAVAELSDHFLQPFLWTWPGKWLPVPANLRFWRAVRRLNQVIYGMIRRRRQREDGPRDVLSRLLAAQRDGPDRLTDRQVRDEMMTLFLAGHETTALALSYTFYLLSSHPEADARLTAELHEVLGDRPPRAADVARLRYTESVVKEAMRLYPPAWGVGREAITDCEVGGYVVPKGTQALMIQWVVHRDPRWFAEPERFRPERWLQEPETPLPRCAYFPFGDGPRICVGNQFAMQEAVLVLATVAQRFRLAAASDEPLQLVASITMRPKHGLRMTVHERPGVRARSSARAGRIPAT